MDFRKTTIRELAERVKTKEISATELVSHALAKIEAHDDVVNAFNQSDGDRALEDAKKLDDRIAAGEDVGPLVGVPLAVKDLENAEGYITTFGSALHADDPAATNDSVLVSRLKAAGCVVVGKTNTPEFAYKGVTDSPTFGHTANPWNLERSPGGSSGGSAAAIAAGMVPLATGSDGGGSIRIPASLTGLSGLKPSQGWVPMGGARPSTTGILSVKGPMTRTTLDAALAFDACIGPEPTDIFSFPEQNADSWLAQVEAAGFPERVVYSPTLGYATVDNEVAAAVEAAVRALESAGVEIIEMPIVFEKDPVLAWVYIWTSSMARVLGPARDTPIWEKVDVGLREQVEMGLRLTALQYAEAVAACHDINLALEKAFAAAPLLICPTIAGHAPLLGEQGTVNGVETPTWVSFTPFINLSRNPAGSVCAGFTSDGMPIGLQVIGRQREDVRVLGAMQAFETVLGIDQVAGLG